MTATQKTYLRKAAAHGFLICFLILILQFMQPPRMTRTPLIIPSRNALPALFPPLKTHPLSKGVTHLQIAIPIPLSYRAISYHNPAFAHPVP